jgi:hypothetical protein
MKSYSKILSLIVATIAATSNAAALEFSDDKALERYFPREFLSQCTDI